MSARLRVVFLGTPGFAVPTLEALLRNHDLLAVYTQPDQPSGRGLAMRESDVKKRAKELGAHEIRQPEKFSDPAELSHLRALSPDLIVVAAYGQILKREALELPRLGCINLHSSLLPRWRGAAPIQRAILEGDRESGVSVQKMVEKLDAGDVLLSEATPIGKRETASTLHDRLSAMGAPLVLRAIEGLASGALKGSPQDESKVTIAKKLTKELQWLNPESFDAETLDRQVRALSPWPGTRITIEGLGSVKILEAEKVDFQGVKAGEIDERFGALVLGCKGGAALSILRLQSEGGKPLDSVAFRNGLRGKGILFPLRAVPENKRVRP